MSSKNKKHTHKYYKMKSNASTVGYLWACALPNCSHHMPEHYVNGLLGKNTICWKCGENTTMDARTMEMDKPLCNDCDPNAIATESIEDAFQSIQELLGKAGDKPNE